MTLKLDGTGAITGVDQGLNVVGVGTYSTDLNVGGNLNVTGVLTYDDVTNIDSVGVITARSGVHVTGGNVGIGTDNPGAKTHIDSTTSNTPLVVEASQNNRSRIVFRNNVETGTECNIELFDDDLRFVTNSGERLRIDVNGNVGINEDVPLAKLHIDGSDDAPCLILPDSTNSRYSVGFGNINVAGVGQRLDFYAGDSGSNTANLTSAARRMSLTSEGRLGIGSDTPQTTLDVAGDVRATGSFILPNNYALVAYDQGHSLTNRSTATTSFADDPDNATCRASFANYQRGDIIIFGSSIAMGVALTTNGSNYAGHKAQLRATNGSATIDSQIANLWYRDDNEATKEVESSSGVSMVIAADNTTFNNGDTVYAYIRHRHNAGNGVSSTGLSKWGGLRTVWGWHYRKVG